jgi:DNA-binding winged helix-turn-helix (wHTH) protein
MRYQFAGFMIDLEARLLQRDGKPLHLSPKAFDLLTHLIAARPRSVPRQELYDRLWPETFVVDTNLPVLIREIRQTVGDDRHAVIRTVHRHGYAFGIDAREVTDRTSPACAPHILIYGASEFPLFPGENVVGRESGAVVRIASPRLSRKHAVITIAGERATIEDLKSKNGTFVDGRSVLGPVVLRDGAVISFGTVEVIYRRLPADGATLTAG